MGLLEQVKYLRNRSTRTGKIIQEMGLLEQVNLSKKWVY